MKLRQCRALEELKSEQGKSSSFGSVLHGSVTLDDTTLPGPQFPHYKRKRMGPAISWISSSCGMFLSSISLGVGLQKHKTNVGPHS